MNWEKPDFEGKIMEAFARIGGSLRRTPVEHSTLFSEKTGGRVSIKWENEQLTGSFKLRGALNRLVRLMPEERQAGIVSASTGNHGLAVSYASRVEKVDLKLFLPETTAKEKRGKIEALGVVPEIWGSSCERTEAYAREFATVNRRIYISPYNDWDIIFGAGTLGLEILEGIPDVDDILVPVGGGGLISGIAGYLKSVKPAVRIIGVEPENSAFMSASVEAGRVVDVPEKETIADAVAGGIESWSVTFPICRDYVDKFLVVPELEIAKAMSLASREHQRMIEGAGALPLAALCHYSWLFKNRVVAAVVTGGNISEDRFAAITEGVDRGPSNDQWNR